SKSSYSDPTNPSAENASSISSAVGNTSERNGSAAMSSASTFADRSTLPRRSRRRLLSENERSLSGASNVSRETLRHPSSDANHSNTTWVGQRSAVVRRAISRTSAGGM